MRLIFFTILLISITNALADNFINIENSTEKKVEYSILASEKNTTCLASIIEQDSGTIYPNNIKTISSTYDDEFACLVINNSIITKFKWNNECYIEIMPGATISLQLNQYCK